MHNFGINGSTAGRVVPAEAIAELAQGSYEHLVSRINEALESQKNLIVGPNRSVKTVATFPGYAVVASDEGQFLRVKYEDINGSIRLSGFENVEVSTYEPKTIFKYAQECALSAVDAMLSKNKDESRNRLRALVSLSESFSRPRGEVIVENVIGALQLQRPWRRLYVEQHAEIKKMLATELKMIEDNSVNPKFTKLYDGTIPEERFEEFRSLVTSDLTSLGERLSGVHTKVEAAYYPFADSIKNLNRDPKDDAVLNQFSTFAEDLIDHLRVMRENLAEALEDAACVMCLGQVHDAIAEGLLDIEIAGRFVENMALRFAESR